MATIIKSNGKRGDNLLSWDDLEVIEHYEKAKALLVKIQADYDEAKSKNDVEIISNISIYLVNVKEVNLALELEIKYRELEWEE